MDDGTYLHARPDQMRHSLSRDSSLPEDRRSVPSPSNSAYAQDMSNTYASVAPFNNYPVPYDSSLPTPVSIAGSPSMNERTAKIMHPYNQHRAGSQQPTPPNTSRSWSNYQMNAQCSQAPSPLSLQHPPPDLLEMHNLEASQSPPEHGHMVSEPPFQWGNYGVSTTEAEEIPPHMTHPMYSMPGIVPTDLHRHQLGLGHPGMALPPPPHIPTLQQQPDPRDLAPSMTPIDHIHPHFHEMQYQQTPHVIMDIATTYSRRKPSKSRNGRSGRPPKRPRASNRALSKRDELDYPDPTKSTTGGDGSVNVKPPNRNITLRADAPEKDRYILELRCQMDGDKGKGIWEEITKKYEERFGKRRQESLQMNLTRAVLKYAEWPQEEDEALLRAVEELDRRRYSDLAKLMKEKYGGCQAWEWKEGHILKRLIDLGVEEFDPEDVTKKPRRKSKKAMTSTSTSTTNTNKRPSSSSGNKPSWVAPMPFEDHHRAISSEQENYILENFCKAEPEYADPNAAAMQGIMEQQQQQQQYHHAVRGSVDMGGGREGAGMQSERVAKQACDQMLLQQQQRRGGSHPGNNMYDALATMGDGHRPM